MIEISNVALPLDALLPGHQQDLTRFVAVKLGVDPDDIVELQLSKKSVDARKKSNVHFVVTMKVSLTSDVKEMTVLTRGWKGSGGVALSTGGASAAASAAKVGSFNVKAAEKTELVVVPQIPASLVCPGTERPLVVGAGPAGLFAALCLARAGMKPLVVERGASVDERVQVVEAFDAGGSFNPLTNIQFGEGGAGTFSDGKLTTNTKNPLTRLVLEWFVQAGAPKEILIEAKPHIGTDKLRDVVRNIRQEIVSLGGEVRFYTQLVDFSFEEGKLNAVTLEDLQSGQRETLPATHVVLACGHSARDTFALLRDTGFHMVRKPFSVGVRIEHPQSLVNESQYGPAAQHPALGAADYKLSTHLPNGRGVYTFCMCPGGQVVAAASEEGGVVVNGMSVHARDGKNANSAVLVSVEPGDFPGTDVLAGVEFQRKLERAAYDLTLRKGGKPYSAPAQRVGDFLQMEARRHPGQKTLNQNGRPVESLQVQPSYPRGVTWCDLHDCLPAFVTESLAQALPQFDAKLHGFANPRAVMTGVETRSSSPVHVTRGANLQALVTKGEEQPQEVDKADLFFSGVYPCGEGAGFAGGIMSAAVDGLKVAQALLDEVCVIGFADLIERKEVRGAQQMEPVNLTRISEMRFDSYKGNYYGKANFSKPATTVRKRAELDPESPQQTYTDEADNTYDYQALKDGTLRILKVTTAQTKLVMPTFIEGVLVTQVNDKAFEECTQIEDLTFPAGMDYVGNKTVRPLTELTYLKLPDALTTVDTYGLHWIKYFERLELPAMMTKISPGFLDSGHVGTLVLGRNMCTIAADAFGRVAIEHIEVDPNNLWFYSDGKALYSKKSHKLVMVAVPSEEYEVLEGCCSIGSKAFSTSKTKRVTLPETVETICEFAFFKAPLESFTAPASLQLIEKKAFFQCEQLMSVQLNEGLQEIGEEAFLHTGIHELQVPHSVCRLGHNFAGEPRFWGEELRPRIVVPREHPLFLSDDDQGIYRKGSTGLTFEMLENASLETYKLLMKCVAIAPRAFLNNHKIQRVIFNSNLQSIGACAFQGCTNLATVGGSESLRHIGGLAFSGTAVTELYLPRLLESLGDSALVTRIAADNATCSAIKKVTLHPQAKYFYKEGGFLFKRTLDSAGAVTAVTAIAYEGKDAAVHFPAFVSEIAANCLVNGENVTSIEFHDGVKTFGKNCFRTKESTHTITIDFDHEPYQGYTRLSFPFALGRNNVSPIGNAFGGGVLDVPLLFASSDESVLKSENMMQWASVALNRLEVPLHLSQEISECYTEKLKGSLKRVFRTFAEEGYLRGFDQLVSQGFVTSDTIVELIDSVRACSTVETMAHLLDLRRNMGGFNVMSAFDL